MRRAVIQFLRNVAKKEGSMAADMVSSKSISFLAVLFSAVVLASSPAFAATFHWKGGTDGRWKTVSNWVENIE